MFDVAIIGTGAAGISSALTLKQLNKDFIWIGDKKLSFKINAAEKISNYPGLIRVSGKEMAETFKKQIEDAKIEITDDQVTGVYNMGDHYSILAAKGQYEAKTVILAVGVESVKPIKGELEYVGRGVSYCATCDGMLYKNKEMTVVATNKEFEDEIEFLASIASNVNLIPLYKNVNINNPKVKIINGMPKEITKEEKIMKLTINNDVISSSVIFMLKAAISPAVLVPSGWKLMVEGLFVCTLT